MALLVFYEGVHAAICRAPRSVLHRVNRSRNAHTFQSHPLLLVEYFSQVKLLNRLRAVRALLVKVIHALDLNIAFIKLGLQIILEAFIVDDTLAFSERLELFEVLVRILRNERLSTTDACVSLFVEVFAALFAGIFLLHKLLHELKIFLPLDVELTLSLLLHNNFLLLSFDSRLFLPFLCQQILDKFLSLKLLLFRLCQLFLNLGFDWLVIEPAWLRCGSISHPLVARTGLRSCLLMRDGRLVIKHGRLWGSVSCILLLPRTLVLLIGRLRH